MFLVVLAEIVLESGHGRRVADNNVVVAKHENGGGDGERVPKDAFPLLNGLKEGEVAMLIDVDGAGVGRVARGFEVSDDR